jgi:NADPH2:quinone reductase
MKAIRIHQSGPSSVMQLEEVPTPTPGEGQLLVKLAAAGLNFIDTYQRSGLYKMELPFTPGNEGAGVVEAVGAGVSGFAKGDRVCYTGVLGAYAEYTLLPAARTIKMPAGMDLKMGAAIMLQGLTAHYLCKDSYPLKKGDACLIHAGAGGVGLLLIQMCKMIGATVLTTVSTDEKAKLAKEAGADHVILYTKDDFEEATRKIMGDRKLDVVYDSVAKTTFDKGLNLLRPRGTMVLYGASSGPVPPLDLQVLNTKGSLYVTRPSLVHHIGTRQELESRTNEVLGWVASGKLKVRIGAEFPLAQAKDAHDALEGRQTTGKVLLIP